MINPHGFCIVINCQNFTVVCLFMKVLHSVQKRQNMGKSAISAFEFLNINPKFIHYMYCKIEANAVSFSWDLGDLMVVATS